MTRDPLAPRPPTPAEQIVFLRALQRLLDEGSFSASYKFALLHAIADLCVQQGDDSGASLELSTAEIADRFIHLYWRQVAPFLNGEREAILRQNTGRRARVLRELAARHETFDGSLASLQRDDTEWSRLRSAVRRTVEVMPLWKLQTVGSERLEFLYPNLDEGRSIRLEPGVAYCFRAFYPMITDMIQGAWSHFVQRRNPDLLGQVVELRSFLFGSERAPLEAPRKLLHDVQRGRCFYCERAIRARGHVDHFIAWRRYPLDLGHNYVLAHASCNGRKADLLAAEEHLGRWADRNRTLGADLESGFDRAGVRHDLLATERIARWAYGAVYRAGGQVWVGGKDLRVLSHGWERVFE